MEEVVLPEEHLFQTSTEGRNESSSSENANFKGSSKTFLCSTCDKTFRSKDTLLRHKMSHSGVKPFSCNICQAGLSSAVALKEHKAKHDSQNLYECSICRRGFRQNSSYRRHLTVHSKMSKYECTVCMRHFAHRSYLRSHMKIHTGEKPYLCSPPCGKSFAHLSDLKRHKVLHTGKRPYQCDICGSSFADKSSCRRHKRDHENKLRNYACIMCKSFFKKATQLEKHLFKIHGVSSTIQFKDKNNLSISESGRSAPTQVCERDLNVDMLTMRKNESFQEVPASHVHEYQGGVPAVLEISAGHLHCKDSFHHFQKNEQPDDISLKFKSLCSFDEVPSKDVNESSKHRKQDSESNVTLCALPQRSHLTSTDYAICPDFSSQEYYKWLGDFVSLCKMLPCPVDSEMFGKINLVHKSLMDCLYSPPEVIQNQTNFKAVIDLSDDLSRIMKGQFNYILNHLPV